MNLVFINEIKEKDKDLENVYVLDMVIVDIVYIEDKLHVENLVVPMEVLI